MEFNKKNWNKPSNPKLKRIADIMVYTLPLYLTAILSLPIDETIKMYINFIMTIIIITFKAISKFTIDQNFKDQ